MILSALGGVHTLDLSGYTDIYLREMSADHGLPMNITDVSALG